MKLKSFRLSRTAEPSPVRRNVAAFLLLIFTASSAMEVAQAQEPEAGRGSLVKPNVKPDPDDLHRARQYLLESVRKQFVSAEVHEEMARKQQAALAGKPQAGVVAHVLALLALRSDVELSQIATGAIEKLKWQIKVDRETKQQRRDETDAKSLALADEIKAQVEVVNKLKEKHPNGDHEELHQANRVLLGLVMHRREMDSYSQQYQSMVAEYDQELADLQKLDDQIGARTRLQTIEVARRRAALKHENTTLVSQPVASYRQELNAVWSPIEARAKKKDGEADHGFKFVTPTPSSVATGTVLNASTTQPLTSDEQKIVEEELQRLKSK